MAQQTVDVALYRELIRRQRATQDTIAVNTGVSQATVHEILSGKCERITTRTAAALVCGLSGNIVVHQSRGGACGNA